MGIGISVMRDHRGGPYLVLVWEKRELSRSSAKLSPEERRDETRMRTAACSSKGKSWATLDPLPIF